MADGIKRWRVTEPWLKMDCGLGEHPFYEPETHTLRFLDIVKKKLHTIRPDEGPESLVTVDLEDSVGYVSTVRLSLFYIYFVRGENVFYSPIFFGG